MGGLQELLRQQRLQLFGSNTFQAGVSVRVNTNARNITLGQQVTIDAASVVGPASTQTANPRSIVLNNDFGPIHPGVNSTYFDLQGNQQTQPIYVAPEQILEGVDVLTPVEMVSVWFEQDIATSTMISRAGTNHVEIDLTEQDDAIRLYSGDAWSTPANAASARGDLAGNPVLRAVVVVTATLTASALASKIGSYLTGVLADYEVEVDLSEGKFKITYSERRAPDVNRAFLAAMAESFTVDQLSETLFKALNELKIPFENVELKAA